MRTIKLLSANKKQIGQVKVHDNSIPSGTRAIIALGTVYILNADDTAEALPTYHAKNAEMEFISSSVYSHPDCVFEYCPHPGTCSKDNSCCVRDAD